MQVFWRKSGIISGLRITTARILVVTVSLQNTSTSANINSATPPKGWREVQSLGWLGLGLYLVLALLTYSPLDPGWSRVSSDTLAVSNSVGVSGAWLADMFFSFLGGAAFLLPVFCVLEVLAIWRPQTMTFKFGLRWLAKALLLVSTSGLLALHAVVPDANIINAAGGIIGLEIGQSLLHSFGLLGSSVLLLSVIALNGTLISGFSWNFLLEALGYIPYAAILNLQASYRRKTEEYKEHQQQKVELQSAMKQAESQFKLNITNNKVQAQIVPVPVLERVEPSFADADFPTLSDEVAVLPSLIDQETVSTETPQLMAELNEVIAGFTQQNIPVVTDEMLSAAPMVASPADISTDVPPAATISQEHQNQLAAEFGAFLGEEEHVEKPVDKMADDWMHEADPFPVLKPEPDVLPLPVKAVVVNDEPEHFLDEAAEKWLAEDSGHDADMASKLDEVVISSAIHEAQIEHPQAIDIAVAHDEDVFLDDEDWLKDDALPSATSNQNEHHIESVLSQSFVDEAIQEIEEAPPVHVLPSIAKTVVPVVVADKPLSRLPSLDLLERPDVNRKAGFTPEQLERLSRLLEIKLREFNIDAKVVDAFPGPVVTRFEVDPAPGVKVAKISNIAKDLARSMAMLAVRVVEVIPGKTVIGIEVPNENRQIVRLQEILSAPVYQERESPITMALGKDISGKAVAADLARMPHLLVAGTTGSGKSVGVNAMILSILYKATPDDVRLILIDPKMLELSIYDKIPHLLTPVVTDMKDAANALRWCVAEMERRYKIMSAVGVRNLAGYNTKIDEFAAKGENLLDPLWKREDTALLENAPLLKKLPFIVVVIDEFADMMMVVGKKVEELIARIAQKARAAGIHLILATQRPSVDVITGLIKANVPSRIAFQVSSKIDSRTILDQGGAEQLLGNGDMLFQPVGTNIPERIHGAFVSDDEVHRVCDDWRSRGEPNYIEEILHEYTDDGVPAKGVAGGMGDETADAEQDVLYDDAVAFVLETRRASISFVQRKFKIGYNRAARLIEAMEMAGLVSSMQNNGQREVLVPQHD